MHPSAKVSAVFFDVFGTLVLYPLMPRVEQIAHQLNRCRIRCNPNVLDKTFAQITGEAGERKSHDGDFARQADAHTKVFYSWYYYRLLELLGVSGDLDFLAQQMFEQYSLIPGYTLDPQVVPVLKVLKRAGIKLGVVSNGPMQVRKVLKDFGLAPFLQTTVISDEFGAEKPDASIFLQALHDLATPANECAYVGDVPEADVAGATNASIALPVLIDRTGKYPNPGLSCTKILAMSELLDILDIRQ